MSTTERTYSSAIARPAPSTAARMVMAFTKLAAVWRAVRNRTQISSLSELDDNQLRDIGLTRHDVRTALSTSTFFEDPSSHLTNSARRRARSSVYASSRD